MTPDRDPWIDGMAKIAGRTYAEEAARWDEARASEPSEDWSLIALDRLEARHGGEEHASDRAADAYERGLERRAS